MVFVELLGGFLVLICLKGKETVKHVVGSKYGYLEDLLYPLFKATHLNYNLLTAS